MPISCLVAVLLIRTQPNSELQKLNQRNSLLATMSKFSLSTTLNGHEQDVKSLVSPNSNLIVSASRDGTVRVWNPTDPTLGWSKSTGDHTVIFSSPTKSFINSLTFIPSDTEPLIANAGQDSMIYVSDLTSLDPTADAKYQLIGHEGNVCSLSYTDGEIISGSWDCSAIVWDLETLSAKHRLEGHEASVWDAKILGDGRYLTASADRSIRLWSGEHEVLRFSGHTDVVRKLLILPNDTFASASNDGTVKIWDLNSGNVLQTLGGHSSFVYDLTSLPNGDIVSTGEDRSVRIWRNGAIFQVITLPCISVWCVAALENGDFTVGGSDKTVRVFSSDPSRFAPEQELLEFKELVENSAIAEQSLDDLKKTDIKGYEELSKPGKKEGAVLMVKSPEGVIEAHQWSTDEWIKIGDVVGSTKSTEKKEFDGQLYDFVFDVDIREGEPALKLPYNANDNPYAAADKFLADNELPSSYTEDIVKFLQKNTENITMDEVVGPVHNPYSDSQQEPKIPKRVPKAAAVASVIPATTPITFKDFKPEQLLKGITKFNSEQTSSVQFTVQDIATLNLSLNGLTSKSALEIITRYVSKIMTKWDPLARLIGIDLLRVSIPHVLPAHVLTSVEGAEVVFTSLNTALDTIDENSLPLLMLLLKTYNNLIENVLFIQLYVDPLDNGTYQFNHLFIETLTKLQTLVQTLSASSEATQNKHYITAVTSLATFVYNLSANHLKTEAFKLNQKAAGPIVIFANLVGDVVVASSSEAAYRFAIAYGNFKLVGVEVGEPAWLGGVVQYDEARFEALDFLPKK